MDRVKIKEEAKQRIKGNLWIIWKPSLFISLISFGISFVIGLIFGAADIDQEIVSCITSSVATIILLPTTYGLSLYILNVIRGKEFSLNDLKAYYPQFVRVFLISLISYLLIAVASILIVPGIILTLAYSFRTFVAVDNEELSSIEVLKKTREMMKGHKLDYFIFGLSFLGWIFLAALTLGILAVWLVPYIIVANALYYENIK